MTKNTLRVRIVFDILKVLGLFLIAVKVNGEVLQLDVSPKFCKEGVINGPDNHFAVYVFCDDAIGTTIGVIKREAYVSKQEHYTGHWKENPANESDRFWTDSSWSRDVNKIIWSENGTKLTVFTSPIYGTGKTYHLDLLQKTFTIQK